MTVRGLLNPGNACYMSAAVQGLLWGAIKSGTFDGTLIDIEYIVNNDDGQSVLRWGNGKWLFLTSQWPRPFDQRDIVEYLHSAPSCGALLPLATSGKPRWCHPHG